MNEQKQPFTGVFIKGCSENMQQTYNFIEIPHQHRCSPVNCCIFSERLFLRISLKGCFLMNNFHSVAYFCVYPVFHWSDIGKEILKAEDSETENIYKVGVGFAI